MTRVRVILGSLQGIREKLAQPISPPTPAPLVRLSGPSGPTEWREVSRATLVTASLSYPTSGGYATFRAYARPGPKAALLTHAGDYEPLCLAYLDADSDIAYPSVTFFVPEGWEYRFSANEPGGGFVANTSVSVQAIETYLRVQ